MTPFATVLLEHIRTERGHITAAQLVADFTLFSRTWAAKEREHFPADINRGVRDAIAELEAYGRLERVEVEPHVNAWKWKAEAVKRQERSLF